jgi:hypothetical protein
MIYRGTDLKKNTKRTTDKRIRTEFCPELKDNYVGVGG